MAQGMLGAAQAPRSQSIVSNHNNELAERAREIRMMTEDLRLIVDEISGDQPPEVTKAVGSGFDHNRPIANNTGSYMADLIQAMNELRHQLGRLRLS